MNQSPTAKERDHVNGQDASRRQQILDALRQLKGTETTLKKLLDQQ